MPKVCATSWAGLKRLSPAWRAVRVQVPAPLSDAVLADTAQLPLAVKTTGSSEDALALIMKDGSPKVRPARGPKAIVWSVFRAATRNGDKELTCAQISRLVSSRELVRSIQASFSKWKRATGDVSNWMFE